MSLTISGLCESFIDISSTSNELPSQSQLISELSQRAIASTDLSNRTTFGCINQLNTSSSKNDEKEQLILKLREPIKFNPLINDIIILNRRCVKKISHLKEAVKYLEKHPFSANIEENIIFGCQLIKNLGKMLNTNGYQKNGNLDQEITYELPSIFEDFLEKIKEIETSLKKIQVIKCDFILSGIDDFDKFLKSFQMSGKNVQSVLDEFQSLTASVQAFKALNVSEENEKKVRILATVWKDRLEWLLTGVSLATLSDRQQEQTKNIEKIRSHIQVFESFLKLSPNCDAELSPEKFKKVMNLYNVKTISQFLLKVKEIIHPSVDNRTYSLNDEQRIKVFEKLCYVKCFYTPRD